VLLGVRDWHQVGPPHRKPIFAEGVVVTSEQEREG
jgi:hypothetical protein